jgi:transcriptional regulator with XRE-family HTH domain
MAVLSEEQLKKLYLEQKLTDKQIAILHNVDRTHISKLRKKYNIPTNKPLKKEQKEVVNPAKRLTNEEREGIRQMYLNGAKWSDIRDQFQVSTLTINRVVNEFIGSRTKKIDKDEIRSLYATGEYSQRELSKLFKVANSTIARITKDINFDGKNLKKSRRKFLFGE